MPWIVVFGAAPAACPLAVEPGGGKDAIGFAIPSIVRAIGFAFAREVEVAAGAGRALSGAPPPVAAGGAASAEPASAAVRCRPSAASGEMPSIVFASGRRGRSAATASAGVPAIDPNAELAVGAAAGGAGFAAFAPLAAAGGAAGAFAVAPGCVVDADNGVEPAAFAAATAAAS